MKGNSSHVNATANTTAFLGRKTDPNDTRNHGPAEPGWFFFTIAFIQVIRYFSNTTEELLREYIGEIKLVHDKETKLKGAKRVAMLLLIRIVMFPFMPFLAIWKQILALPILFKIGHFKKLLLPPSSFKDQVRLTWSVVKQSIAFAKKKILLFTNDEEQLNSSKGGKLRVQETIDTIIKENEFKDEVFSEWCQCQTKLAELSEAKFFEAFLESGPQTILQLMIFLQLGMDLSLVRFLTILTSFSTLAQTVVVYYNSSLKKNPVRRELTAVGQGMVFLCKTPAIISRCLALSVFLTSQKLEVF